MKYQINKFLENLLRNVKIWKSLRIRIWSFGTKLMNDLKLVLRDLEGGCQTSRGVPITSSVVKNFLQIIKLSVFPTPSAITVQCRCSSSGPSPLKIPCGCPSNKTSQGYIFREISAVIYLRFCANCAASIWSYRNPAEWKFLFSSFLVPSQLIVLPCNWSKLPVFWRIQTQSGKVTWGEWNDKMANKSSMSSSQ